VGHVVARVTGGDVIVFHIVVLQIIFPIIYTIHSLLPPHLSIPPHVACPQYSAMTKTLVGRDGRQCFKLHVEAGRFMDSQIIVMLGENGTGKVCA
jgi:hypothetical protein